MEADVKPILVDAKADGEALPQTAEVVDGKLIEPEKRDEKGDVIAVDPKEEPVEPIEVVPVECVAVEASVAMSATSLAIRLVPVDAKGIQHPLGTQAIVGDLSDPDIASYLVGHDKLLAELLAAKGF